MKNLAHLIFSTGETADNFLMLAEYFIFEHVDPRCYQAFLNLDLAKMHYFLF